MAASTKAKLLLNAVKKISIRFCPFEPNVRSTREFLFMVGSEKVRSTNANCEVVTEVKHDKSAPIVDVTFTNGDRLVMNGANLTSAEMMSAFQSRLPARDA
ncbi:large ribosomal subunit protein mL53-like [Brachionichthys hirsutus]|uniref:large ribosomal subunit protein mL53-like n=1 Tax=Brachionichthys hirsutus TaxID=412623 RepID=UPI003604AA0F